MMVSKSELDRLHQRSLPVNTVDGSDYVERIEEFNSICGRAFEDGSLIHVDNAQSKANEKELAAEFNRGYVIACLNSFNLHGDGVITSDTFNQLGISKAEIEAMDLSEYDASALAELEKNYPIFYKEDD